jgi:hypothetical protein
MWNTIQTVNNRSLKRHLELLSPTSSSSYERDSKPWTCVNRRPAIGSSQAGHTIPDPTPPLAPQKEAVSTSSPILFEDLNTDEHMQIIKYLSVQDLVHLAQTSKIFQKRCKTNLNLIKDEIIKGLEQLQDRKTHIKALQKSFTPQSMAFIRRRFKVIFHYETHNFFPHKQRFNREYKPNQENIEDTEYLVLHDILDDSNEVSYKYDFSILNAYCPNLKFFKIRDMSRMLTHVNLMQLQTFNKLESLDLSDTHTYAIDFKALDKKLRKAISGYCIDSDITILRATEQLSAIPQKLKKMRIEVVTRNNLDQQLWRLVNRHLAADGCLSIRGIHPDAWIKATSIPEYLRNRVVSYALKKDDNMPSVLKLLPALREITIFDELIPSIDDISSKSYRDFIEENDFKLIDLYLHKNINLKNKSTLIEKGIQICIGNINYDRVYIPNEDQSGFRTAEPDEIIFY